MAEEKTKPVIDVSKRPAIRNWLIKISDIRRILIHRDPQEGSVNIEIRYNCSDGADDKIDKLTYSEKLIVEIFYKILICMKKAKRTKDEYILILEDNVYLLSEIDIINSKL